MVALRLLLTIIQRQKCNYDDALVIMIMMTMVTVDDDDNGAYIHIYIGLHSDGSRGSKSSHGPPKVFAIEFGPLRRREFL